MKKNDLIAKGKTNKIDNFEELSNETPWELSDEILLLIMGHLSTSDILKKMARSLQKILPTFPRTKAYQLLKYHKCSLGPRGGSN